MTSPAYRQPWFDRFLDGRCKDDITRFNARFASAFIVCLLGVGALFTIYIMVMDGLQVMDLDDWVDLIIFQMFVAWGMSFPVMLYALFCAVISSRLHVMVCQLTALPVITLMWMTWCYVAWQGIGFYSEMIIFYVGALFCGSLGMAAARGTHHLLQNRTAQLQLMADIEAEAAG